MQEAGDFEMDWRPVATNVMTPDVRVKDISPRKDYRFRIRAEMENGDLSEPTPPIQYYRSKMPMVRDALAEFKPIEYKEIFLKHPYYDILTKYVPPSMPINKPELILINQETVELSWRPAIVAEAIRGMCNLTYTVEVRCPPSFEWRELVAGLKSCNHTVSNLHPRVDYVFRVRAWNEYGSSEAGLPVSLYRRQVWEAEEDYDEEFEKEWERKYGTQDKVELLQKVPPKLPIDTPNIVTQTQESIWFSWLPARIPAYAKKANITYVVEIKEPPSTAWQREAEGLCETFYVKESLDPNREYHIRVRAETEFGPSEPTMPIIIRGKGTGSRPTSRRSSMERDDLGEKIDLSYLENVMAGVPPRMPSTRPMMSRVGPDRLTLSWSSSRTPSYVRTSNITYIIEKREPPGHVWTVVAKDITGHKYEVTGLDPNRDYMFRVRAKNEFGLSDPTLPMTIYRDRDDYVPPKVRSRSSSRDSINMLVSKVMKRSSSVDYGTTRMDDDRSSEERMPVKPEYVTTTYDTQYGVMGRKGKIKLQVRGYPLPTIHWYKDEEKIQYGDQYNAFITPTGDITLEIKKVGADTLGQYKCYAENPSGAAAKVVTFELAEAPTALETIKDVTALKGDSVTLTCKVDGFHDASVKWMKDWRPLADCTRIKIVNVGDMYFLEIINLFESDEGLYACTVENIAGKVTISGRLKVEIDSIPGFEDISIRTTPIEERYHVLEEIGRGRYGVVRRVVEISTGRTFAANFMTMRNKAQKNFFMSEFEVLRSVRQMDGVLKLYDAFETERSLILVTELLSEPELLEKIITDGNWTEVKVISVIRKLLTILRELEHLRIQHLDIKPSNIRLCGADLDNVKLLGFGLSRVLPDDEDITHNYGSVGYASPEQVTNDILTTTSDTWALGVLAYILLSGYGPFQGSTAVEILTMTKDCKWSFEGRGFEKFSKEGRDFISKLLVKDPSKRMTVEQCLDHLWMSCQSEAKINTDQLKQFYNAEKLHRETEKVYTTVQLQSFAKILHGAKAFYQPAVDIESGEIIFPDADEYGDYLDEDAWYEWQLQYLDDPDSQVYPIQDKGFTVREARHAGTPKYSLAKKERSDKDEFDHGKGIMFRDKIQPTTFQVGDNVTFYATVVCETKETPVVTWYRDEQLLSDDYRADADFNEETGVAKLTINNTKDYDAAVYKCVARIKDGRVSCEARLFLGDVPSRPGCPLVMQTSGQEAFLTWTPPVSDGNAYLLGYRVDIRKMGDKKWTHGPYVTEEYALLTGLESSSSYIFRVSAHNKYGQSPFSWSSLEAKTLAPDAPKVSIATDLQPLMQFSTFDKQQMVLPAESRRPSLTVQPEAKVCEADPAETYTFSDTLSKGSFAEYRLCVSKTTNQQCVAKVIPYKKDNHDSITAEFELLRNLRQSNLITVLDGYIHADTFYVIFEKLSGINIVQYLCLHKTYKEETVARMVRQILDALQYLEHYGIVHLNLQPSSVVMATGRRPLVKLRDFTLAQKIDPDVGSPVPLAGYPDYTAPEVIKGEKVKFTADLWTLGALTFTMLSGISPFAGKTLEETVSRILFDRYSVKEMYDNVSKESIKFVCKLMCRLPRNRPTVNKCLNSQWLSFNETMVNARNSKMFSSEKLGAFSVEYLAKRGDCNYSLAKVDIENLPKITTGPVIRPILSDRITHRLENAMKTKKKTVILPQPIESESKEVVEEGLLDKITSKIEKDIEMEEKAAVEVIEETEQILEKENLVKVSPMNVSEEKIIKVNTEEESEAVSRNKEEISEEMNISVTETEKIDELKETVVDEVVARIADEKKHELPEAQETLIDAKEISQVETVDKVETKAVTEVWAKKEEKAAVTEQEVGNSLVEKVEVSETNAEKKRDGLVEKPDVAVLTSAVVEKEEDDEMYESADESVQETVHETISAVAGSVAKEVSLTSEKDMPGEINEKLESTTIEPELYTEKESQLKAAEMMKVSDVHKQTENVKEKVEEKDAEFVDAAESQEVKEKAEVIGSNNHEEGDSSVSKSEISEEVQVKQSAEAHREEEALLCEEVQVKKSEETHTEGEAGLCKSEVSQEVQKKESAEAIREEKASLGEEVQVKQSAETHREEEAGRSEEVLVQQSVETHREGEAGLSKSEASEEVQEKESAEAIREEEASLSEQFQVKQLPETHIEGEDSISEDVQVKQTAEKHRDGEASLSEEVQVMPPTKTHREGETGLSEVSEEVQEKESAKAHREGEASLSKSVSEEGQEKQSAETCETDGKTRNTEASEVESKVNSYGQIEQMATKLIEEVKEAALKEMAGVMKFADNLEEEDLKRCHKEQSSVTATEELLSSEQQLTEKVITNEAVKTETLPPAGKKSETNEQVETADSGASKQVTNNEISEEAATSDSTVKADERLATESDIIISVESVTKTSKDMGLVTTELIENVSQLESEASIKQSEVNIYETETKETLITVSSESSSEQSHILSENIENKEPQSDKALQKEKEGAGRESTTAATDQPKAKSEANNELVKTDVESLDSTSQSSQDTQSRKQSEQDKGESSTQAASLADTASALSPVIEHSVKENLEMERVKFESENTSQVQTETEARIQKSKEDSVISKESLVEKNSITEIAESDEELKKDKILENELISESELAEQKESKMITNETLPASDTQKTESTEAVESSVTKVVERGVDIKASDVSLKEITTVSTTMEVAKEESEVKTESVIGTAQEITQSASECMSVEKSESIISITKEEKTVVKSTKEDVDGAVLELATVSQPQESVSSEHISTVSDLPEQIEHPVEAQWQQTSDSRQMEMEGTASEKVTVSETQETISSEHISASTVDHAESVIEKRMLQTSHEIVKDTDTNKTVSETAEETMISESADKSEILANGIESEVDSVAQEILTYSVSVAGKLETAKVTESRETIREFVTNDDDIEEMKKELLEDSEVSSAECGKYLLGLHEEAVTGEHAEGEVKPDEEQIAKETANRYIDDALMFC